MAPKKVQNQFLEFLKNYFLHGIHSKCTEYRKRGLIQAISTNENRGFKTATS